MRFDRCLWALGFCAALVVLPAQAAEMRYGFGHTPTAAEIARFDIDIRPDGTGLPPGHGSVAEGAKIFASTCATCHGEKGDNAKLAGNQLVGGIGSLASAKPVKTIGSYWPYATTVFDYIKRAMPYTSPQSLSDNEVYALTAYLLSLNGIVPDTAVLDAKTLPQVEMPNRDGFTPLDGLLKSRRRGDSRASSRQKERPMREALLASSRCGANSLCTFSVCVLTY